MRAMTPELIAAMKAAAEGASALFEVDHWPDVQAHIAASSPIRVLALITELERAREERDDTQAALEKLERHDRNMMVDWASRLQAAESLNTRSMEEIGRISAIATRLTEEREGERKQRQEADDRALQSAKDADRLQAELAEAREAEREACAAICEEQAREFLNPEYATGQPLSSFSERFACSECAKAIRVRAIADGAK